MFQTAPRVGPELCNPHSFAEGAKIRGHSSRSWKRLETLIQIYSNPPNTSLEHLKTFLQTFHVSVGQRESKIIVRGSSKTTDSDKLFDTQIIKAPSNSRKSTKSIGSFCLALSFSSLETLDEPKRIDEDIMTTQERCLVPKKCEKLRHKSQKSIHSRTSHGNSVKLFNADIRRPSSTCSIEISTSKFKTVSPEAIRTRVTATAKSCDSFFFATFFSKKKKKLTFPPFHMS